MAIINLRLFCVGPPMLAALVAAYRIWAHKVSLGSSRILRQLTFFLVVRVVSHVMSVANGIHFFLRNISSVFFVASLNPLSSSHDFVLIITWLTFLLATANIASHNYGRNVIGIRWGISMRKISSYVIFHRSGPRIDPWAAPDVIYFFFRPWFVL